MDNYRRISKLTVAVYLLRRLSWYPDVWRRIRVNLRRALLSKPMGRSRTVAEKWAAARAISASEVLETLGGVARNLDEDFPYEMAEAGRVETAEGVEPGVGGSASLVYAICEATQARHVVETGVAHGFTSLAILLSVRKRDGHLWSVDMPSPSRHDQRQVGIVVPEMLRDSWTLQASPDSVGLPKVLASVHSLDFCHYDSDKSYEGRLLSYPRLWEKLRPGGILMSDDIEDNTAFRDFAAEVRVNPMVVYAPGSGCSGDRYVGLIRKP